MRPTAHNRERPPAQGRIVGRIKREYRFYRALLADPRTPTTAKWLIGGGVAYVLLPFDLIPDFIPVIGQLDDILIAGSMIGLGVRLVPKGIREDDRSRSRRVRVLFDDETMGPVLFQCDALNAPFGIHINTCGRDADIQGPVLFPLLDLMFEYGLVTVSESRSGNNHFDDYTLHITNVDESRTYNQQIRLDINFRPLPLIAAIMYCKSDSEDAARFVDTRAAYLALPRKLKRRIQGLRLRWQPCPEIRLDAVLDDGVTTANRNASHVVTGAQFLNLLIREKCSIVDLSDKEADSLLTSVCNHALQETFCYTHAHSDGDLITWNPRQILHVPSAGAKGMPKYIYPRTLSGTILGGIVES